MYGVTNHIQCQENFLDTLTFKLLLSIVIQKYIFLILNLKKITRNKKRLCIHWYFHSI